MKYSTRDATKFRDSVDRALDQVKTILGTTKNLGLAEDEPDHTYHDKFALAEFLTKVSISAILQVMGQLGLDSEKLQILLDWVHKQDKIVTMEFRAQEICSFVSRNHVQRYGSGSERLDAVEIVMDQVEHHHWKVILQHCVVAYAGMDKANAIELQSGTLSTNVVTSAGMADPQKPRFPQPPMPLSTTHHPIRCNITWLLLNLSNTCQQSQLSQCRFEIDRQRPGCKTPRRNKQVGDALAFHQTSLGLWVKDILSFFSSRNLGKPFTLPKDGPLDNPNALDNTTTKSVEEAIFRPIVPWMEKGSVLSPQDTGTLLKAHIDSMLAVLSQLRQISKPCEAGEPPAQEHLVATTKTTTLIALCRHLELLIEQYQHSIGYIEGMLEAQLICAIGKELDSHDFDHFIRLSTQTLFKSQYAPKPFSYAIRRTGHCPDGMLSIKQESVGEEACSMPIETLVRRIPGGANHTPILMPINSATTLKILGDRFLHGWIQHRFRGTIQPKWTLVARACQFSSFLLVLGTMAGRGTFLPRSAIILQNKDELLIPLETETLPSAKEFNDAISSLSPEQPEFAKAYRELQLESSVFGLCIIQLRPQLEKVLNLGPSLTKEIQLTQDLVSLFVTYQIPSDLFSYDGDLDKSEDIKVDEVRNHVKAVLGVIDAVKVQQLVEAEQKADFAVAQPLASESIWVTVQTLTGARIMVELKSDDLVDTLKRKIHDEDGTPPDQQRIVFKGVQLGDGRPLHHYGITDGSTLNVVIRLNGGFTPRQPERSRYSAEPYDEPADMNNFMLVPKLLDSAVEKLDSDSSLKSTILKAGSKWEILRQDGLLLRRPRKRKLWSSSINDETKRAFDLLEAISRSGSLSLDNDCAELHVIVGLTHCFENDVMGTVLQENINPIPKAERSFVIVASIIHNEPPSNILASTIEANQLKSTFPNLFDEQC